MLLARGLYWFDYRGNVHVESPVTLMPHGETKKTTLEDDGTLKQYDQKPHTVRYSKCCQMSDQ